MHFIRTSGKGHGSKPLSPDASLARLKRAVFQSMVALDGNADVLRGALTRLSGVHGPEVADYQDAAINHFNDLMRLRRQWLKENALPAFDKAASETFPERQEEPQTDVALPRELDILVNESGLETFTSRDRIETEISLLDDRLHQR
jgi:hypothetical protein